MRTITATFNNRTAAEAVQQRLGAAGIGQNQMALAEGLMRGPMHRSGNRRSTIHRDLFGDYIDSRTDRRLMEGAGSRRSALGDYLDGDNGKRLMEGAGSRRGALGDYIDSATGKRVMDGAGSRRGALGDYIDAQTGKRLMEGAGSKRSPLGDYVDQRTGKRLADSAGSRRTALGDYLDTGGKRLMAGAGSPRGPLGDYLTTDSQSLANGASGDRGSLGGYTEDGTGQRLKDDAGSDRTAIGDFIGKGPGHVDGDTQMRTAAGAPHQICVLTVRVNEADIDRIIDIIEADASVDVDVTVTSWRNEGWRPTPGVVDMGSRGPALAPKRDPLPMTSDAPANLGASVGGTPAASQYDLADYRV